MLCQDCRLYCGQLVSIPSNNAAVPVKQDKVLHAAHTGQHNFLNSLENLLKPKKQKKKRKEERKSPKAQK